MRKVEKRVFAGFPDGVKKGAVKEEANFGVKKWSHGRQKVASATFLGRNQGFASILADVQAT